MMPIPPEREAIVESQDKEQHHTVTHVWHRFFVSVWQFIRQIFPTLINTPLWVWDDVRFPASRSYVNPTTSKPAFDSVNVGLVLETGNSEPMTFIGQLPHQYRANTNVRPHFHGRYDSTNTSNFVIEFSYKWYNNDEVPPAWSITNFSFTPSGVAEQAFIKGFGNVDGSNKKESSIFKAKIRRVAAHADDIYPTNIYFDEFDFHYPVEKMGTGPEYPGH